MADLFLFNKIEFQKKILNFLLQHEQSNKHISYSFATNKASRVLKGQNIEIVL